MGIGCCNYKEKPKEKEVILPKIKYNIYEINRMAKINSNNDNIMTNINEQDIISRSSQGYELDKKYDSIDSSPNNHDKIQSNNSSIKYRLLGQIKEKEQKYEQDQEDNSNNEGFNKLEKINVNHLINDVDNLYKQHINNKKNNIKMDELKEMNQINYNSKNMDEYYKMNQYNIDIESQNKIRGDFNTNNNFENSNSNEEYPIEENKNYNNKDESLNNGINLETKNENVDEQNNENNDGLFQIEVNELVNSDNNYINNSNNEEELEPKNNTMNNNEYNQENGIKINNDINNIKKDSLENNDFPENNNKIKNSFNNLDNLDDYPLIDDDNNNNFNNKIISNKEEINSMNSNGEKYFEDKNEFFSNNMNQLK